MKINFGDTVDVQLQLVGPALEHLFGEHRGALELKYTANGCAKMPSVLMTIYTVRQAGGGVAIRPLHIFWLN